MSTDTNNTPRANHVADLIENASGALAWWDFDSIRVKPSVMAALVKKHGLTDIVPNPSITQIGAIRAAATGFSSGRGRSTNDGKVKAEVVGIYDDGSVEVALLKHETLATAKKAAEKVRWSQFDSVVFNTDNDGWEYVGTSDAAKRFVADADNRMSHLRHDFVRRHCVHRPITRRLGGFPLRRSSGGFYFVPKGDGNLDTLDKLSALVADLPSDCHLNVVHITDTKASQMAIGRAATSHLATEMGTLKQKIAAWKEANRTPRKDAVENALDAFQALRDNAALYRDVLKVEIADLEAEMTEAIAVAAEIIAGAEKGIPPVFIQAVRSLVDNYGAGNDIPLADVAEAGLPDKATDEKAAPSFWRKGRGSKAAALVGYTALVTDGNLVFTAVPSDDTDADAEATLADEEADVQPDQTEADDMTRNTADLEAVEDATDADDSADNDADPLDEIMAMDVPKLRKAIERVTGTRPGTKARKPALQTQLREAMGL